MGYQLGAIKGVPQISCLKELLPLREDIQNNVQHKGKNFEIVYQAMCDIRKHYGRPAPNVKGCRSACVTGFNKTLTNWFKEWDAAGRPSAPVKASHAVKHKVNAAAAVAGSTDDNNLVPLEQRRKTLMDLDWPDLQELAVEELGEEKIKELKAKKNGKPLSRVEYVDAMLG